MRRMRGFLPAAVEGGIPLVWRMMRMMGIMMRRMMRIMMRRMMRMRIWIIWMIV